MKKPIHKFFWVDLVEEQHQWSLDQLAFVYQTSEEEVQLALLKANEALSNNPLSTCYVDPELDPDRCDIQRDITQSCGDVHGRPGEAWAEGREGVALGSDSS
jgi:hypothetical protein